MLCQRTNQDHRICVVRIEKDLDENTVPGLMSEVSKQCSEGVQAFVVDCSKLRFISSYGLGVLLRIRKYARDATGASIEPVALAGAPSAIIEVLRVARLSEVFPASHDLAASVQGMAQRLGQPA